MYDLVIVEYVKEYLKINYKGNVSTNQDKANCLSTKSYHSDMDMTLQRPRGANKGGLHTDKSPTLSANAWEQNNLVVTKKKKGIRQLNPSNESNGKQPYQQNRVYDTDGRALALMNGHAGRTINVLLREESTDAIRIRRLTPTECARLQTIPTWYKWNVSETQQYKMLGNGWTIEVIKHIFSF